jgi:hypothetical protein
MEIMVVTVEPQHLVLGYLLLGAVEALLEPLIVVALQTAAAAAVC